MNLYLITDRTAADAAYAEEILSAPWDKLSAEQKAAYNSGLRGAYSLSDFGRVENAVANLAGAFLDLPEELKAYAEAAGSDWRPTDLPYDPNNFRLETKSQWTESMLFDAGEQDRYLRNVLTFRTSFAPELNLPESVSEIDLRGANNIEAVLKKAEAVYNMLRERYLSEIAGEIANIKIHSGEVFSGEVSA